MLDRIIHIATNITQKKRSEVSLHEVILKLRLLVNLTCHDIVNQVSILKSLQDLSMSTSDPQEIHKYLSHAHDPFNRIEEIIEFTQVYENLWTVSSDWRQLHQIIDAAKTEISLGIVKVTNEIPDDLEIYADPIIRKVFSTLIENAIRHGENITYIRFYCSEQDELLVICFNHPNYSIFKDRQIRLNNFPDSRRI